MTVRGVPELSQQQPGPDPVGQAPETYSDVEHKGQEAGEAGDRPHPFLALPDLSRLSPPHQQLGERLGARYHSIETSMKLPRFGSSGSARRHPGWPRLLVPAAAAEPSTGDSRRLVLLHTPSAPPHHRCQVISNLFFRTHTSPLAPC